MTYGFPSSVFPLLLPYSLSCAGCKEDKINTGMILIVSLHLVDFIQGGLSGPVCVSAFITIQSGHRIWWEKPSQASRQCGGELSICLEIHRILPLSLQSSEGTQHHRGKLWNASFEDWAVETDGSRFKSYFRWVGSLGLNVHLWNGNDPYFMEQLWVQMK